MTRRLAPRAAPRALAALLVVLAVLPGAAVPAAAQVRASVRVSPTRVAVGGRVAYTLTLRGAPGRAFATPPATAGLRAVQSSPTSDATLQVNGDLQRELTWTFEAVRPGPARIGPFRVDLGGGREVNVPAASVTVAGAAAPNAQTARGRAAPPVARAPGERADLFARIELSDARVVVGQQVVAEVVLYFDPDLQPRQTLAASSWDAPGFWREELDVASTVPHPVTLGGRAFEAVTLMRLALFPTRAGRLTLPPMRFAVDFLRVDPFGIDPNDPFAPFFAPFSGGLEEAEVEAPATSLDVSALPPGAPAGFSGAVGQFTMQAAPVASAASVGDPVQIEVTVAGTGNVATLGAPTLATPRGADAFPPRDEADIDRTGDRIRGRRLFRYTLVPQAPGALDVPPAVWAFFDPATGTYQTLRTDSARVAVSPGQPGPGAAAPAGGAGPAADLIAEASWSRRGLPASVLWGVLGTGLALPALALGAVAVVRRRRRAAFADTPENRRRHALARAEARLADARAGVEAGTRPGPDACAAAERAVHAFLSDRFGVASAGLDRTALAAALDAVAVPGAGRVLAVLAALDVGQFAPALARAAPEATLDEARAALIATVADPAPPRRARRAAVAALVGLAAVSHPASARSGDGPTAEADRLVALGTQLAAEGDAAGAEAAFSGAADAGRALGRASAAVEHDLGTLALARGDAGRARLHTERAARLDPFDGRIATNAARARALARVPPETPGERAWRTARGIAGPAGLVALALALVYGALGLALAGRRRAAFGLGAVALAAVLAAAGALAEAPRGVVLTAADLREAPAPDAAPGRTVAPGAVVQVGERRGAWRAVRVDGRAGWVPAGAVEALAP